MEEILNDPFQKMVWSHISTYVTSAKARDELKPLYENMLKLAWLQGGSDVLKKMIDGKLPIVATQQNVAKTEATAVN